MTPCPSDHSTPITGLEMFTHIITVPWRLLFAVVPPRKYCNGWVALTTCVVFIFGLTYMMREIILTVGCFLNIAPVL
jgi:magnesium/proton exchanger